MNPRNFFTELTRRNVYKVAAAYAVVSWLLIQAASIILPTFEAPGWTMKVLIAALAVGFPIAVVLAWAFEITAEGIVRAEDVIPNKSIARRTGRKLVGITMALAVIAAGLLGWQLVERDRWARRAEDTAAPIGRPRGPFLPVPEKSIAVLPFENLSSDQENAYFSEGIQDEILTRLARIADLKVISRTSTQRFKSAPGDLRQIAQQLGVTNIMEGSVQKSADQVRVNVQLINAITDAHLWADTYDRKLTDIFAVESEIAKAVADALRAKLSGSEEHALAKRPTENPEAHELYLKGRFLWNKRTEADLRKAIQYFQQAIEKDPSYALAYAGMADCYDVLFFHSVRPIRGNEVFPQAKAAALKAIELDETSAQAHAALAKALFEYYWDFAGAEKEFRRAIELNPNYATVHQWNCEYLSAMGRFEESAAEIKRAHELDPLSMIINAMAGLRYYWARQYPEAVTTLRASLTIDPNFPAAHGYLGEVYEAMGNYEGAIAERQQAEVLYGRQSPQSAAAQAGSLRQAYAAEGARGYWHKILELALQDEQEGDVDLYALAAIYAHLGDKDKALQLLKKACDEHVAASLLHLNDDAAWDDLRGDPRFRDLVRRIGFR